MFGSGSSAAVDEESFTAARHHAIRSMTTAQVPASSSLTALAAAADAAARATLHTLKVPGRDRHSRRAQKARPKFARASATKKTVMGNRRSRCSHPDSPSPATRNVTRQEGGPPRPPGAADRGPARHSRRDTRAETIPAHHPETDFRVRTEQQNR